MQFSLPWRNKTSLGFLFLGLLTLLLGVSAAATSCTNSTDTPPVKGAGGGMFLTFVTIEGAPVVGSVVVTEVGGYSNSGGGDEKGATGNYNDITGQTGEIVGTVQVEANIDPGGKAYLNVGNGTWQISVYDSSGEVLACDTSQIVVEGNGVFADTVVCQ